MFSIGDKLVEARQKNGQSIKDAEKETKIRAKYLEALEQNKFDLIPGDAYVAIFLREYANFLKIDPDPLVAEYREKHENISQNEGLSPIDFEKPRKGRRRAFMVFSTIVLLLAGGFFIWRSGLWEHKYEKALINKKEKSSGAKAVNKSGKNAATDEQRPESTDVESGDVLTEFVVKVSGTGAAGSSLKVQVDGENAFDDRINVSEVKEWSAKKEVVLTIGNPAAVEIEKDGVRVEDIDRSQRPLVKVLTP